jgi:Mor family transcriptional regulator
MSATGHAFYFPKLKKSSACLRLSRIYLHYQGLGRTIYD